MDNDNKIIKRIEDEVFLQNRKLDRILQAFNQPQEHFLQDDKKTDYNNSITTTSQEEIEEIKSPFNIDVTSWSQVSAMLTLKSNEHTRAINQLNEVVRKLNKRNNDPSPT